MSDIVDLSVPVRIFLVPTVKVQGGVAYMGPDIKINAHSAEDARLRVEAAGYKVNNNFGVTQINPKPRQL